MRAYELLVELAVPKTKQFTHGKYLLVHTVEPDKKDMYAGQIYDPDKKQLDKITNQNIDALKKEFMDIAVEHQRNNLKKNLTKKAKVSANDVERAALDLNTSFTKRAFENQTPTAIRLGTAGGKLIIDVMTREYFEMDGASAGELFKIVRDRGWSKNASTKTYGVSGLSPKKLEQMGFEFHGVYDLTDAESPDSEEFKRYSLDLIGYSDKKTSYAFPAITIAYWPKGNKSHSGPKQ